MTKLFPWEKRGLHSQVRGGGGTVVSVRVCKPRVPGSIPRYPLATCHYLVSPPSGQRLSKLLPYCPQTGLTMSICI